MTFENILYEVKGRSAVITLNRPDKLNAIGAPMITELHAAMDMAEADDTVLVIIVRGAGKSFSSGFDLGEVEVAPEREVMRAMLKSDFDIIMRFWHSPKPTISAIRGYALGGGFELAMACDVSIASPCAVFGEPEPKFGSGIVALILPWITGPKQAKEMLLFGNDRISAQRAYDMGLINRIVDLDKLDAEAERLARSSGLLDQTASRLTKQAINKTYEEMGFGRAMQMALDIDLDIEVTDTEESRIFKTILNTQGVKAAIAWREARWDQVSDPSNPSEKGSSMTFKAFVVRKDEDGSIHQAIENIDESTLPAGNVTVDVQYSTVNYKDGMCMGGQGRLVRNYPHIPGIDFSGVVSSSTDDRYKAGDPVVLTGWRVGETHWGGYATKARLNADWLVPLPKGLTARNAMAVGTAGLTAMLAVMALEDHGLTPDQGEVLVTGAAGGVGSVATAILAKLGYSVACVTGRAEAADYLKSLGASRIVMRDEIADTVKAPLETETWAGCVDAVGGSMLARVLGQMKYGASVASVGLAGGAGLPTTVMPFLLRGVNLLGIDSVMQPFANRQRAWQRIAQDLPLNMLEQMITPIAMTDLAKAGEDILKGQVRGRLVLDVSL